MLLSSIINQYTDVYPDVTGILLYLTTTSPLTLFSTLKRHERQFSLCTKYPNTIHTWVYIISYVKRGELLTVSINSPQ